jgi:hypothetical protein
MANVQMKKSPQYVDSSASFQPTPTLQLHTSISEMRLFISYRSTYLIGAHALDLQMKSSMNSEVQTGKCFEELG